MQRVADQSIQFRSTMWSILRVDSLEVDISTNVSNVSATTIVSYDNSSNVNVTIFPYNTTDPNDGTIFSNLTDLEKLIGPKRDPLPAVLVMSVVYLLIMLTGTIGNLCTCIVIARKRYMHTATNFYLFSLAVSDLLLLLLGLPQDMVLLWQKYPYIFGERFCILRGWTSELSTNASILTITMFTIERFVAICYPLRRANSPKLGRVVKVIALCWTIAAICATPIAIQFGIVYVFDDQQFPYIGSEYCAVKRLLYPYIFEIATMAFFVIPICIITILYIMIGIKLRASSRGSTNTNPNSVQRIKFGGGGKFPNNNSRQQLSMSIRRQNASRRAVIKMLVAVVISFFFCYSPFHAQRVLAIVLDRNNVTDGGFIRLFTILTHISGVTYYLSATINPILYQVMSKKFQMALRETLPCCKPIERHDVELTFSTVLPSSGTARTLTNNAGTGIGNKSPSQYGKLRNNGSPIYNKSVSVN
ncbi:hypothetical protein RDWZM_005828 [Blomia tropicalis]|uniref:G-protein coupled receptors family 1 profile domain-containing protein n=1 Tax=Blomia tropicalis TaxID=40697 RepID=A0A9Q0RNS9_BLOTA|nr:hypothetical protein RDWZM_005828 [Blomia tropicalis]